MATTWRMAGVQMAPVLADKSTNMAAVLGKLDEAARGGAKLIVFPECALTGYCFDSRADAAASAETVPGPSTAAISEACARLDVFAVVGLLESDGDKLYNSAILVGPAGFVAVYRKTHLPCLGADRFVDPGTNPFVVHDLGGLKVGVNICFDASFPEVTRVFTVLGADLVVLPTNWADNAFKMASMVPPVRALENHIYYMAVNRVGTEAGNHFVGHSSACHFNGDYLHYADHDREEIIYADLDPEAARQKRQVHCLGVYEIDRVNWRRPDLYGPLVEPMAVPFAGHSNG